MDHRPLVKLTFISPTFPPAESVAADDAANEGDQNDHEDAECNGYCNEVDYRGKTHCWGVVERWRWERGQGEE